MSEGDKGTVALGKGIALLAAIVRDDARSPASTVAAALGMPASSARRTLAALARQGLVARVARGRYAAGPLLAELAGASAPHRALVRVARAPLARLARAHDATAHLGVLDGDMVTYLVKEGRDEVFTRKDQQLEAYCTGIGKALLAALPDDRVAAYLAGDFVALTATTITDPDHLRQELRRTRQRGYAIDDREMADDLACVAVPLVQNGVVLAAISLSSRPGALPHPAVVAARLRRCAAAIAVRLG